MTPTVYKRVLIEDLRRHLPKSFIFEVESDVFENENGTRRPEKVSEKNQKYVGICSFVNRSIILT